MAELLTTINSASMLCCTTACGPWREPGQFLRFVATNCRARTVLLRTGRIDLFHVGHAAHTPP
eukprot:814253-Amphidinium_carterae.1